MRMNARFDTGRRMCTLVPHGCRSVLLRLQDRVRVDVLLMLTLVAVPAWGACRGTGIGPGICAGSIDGYHRVDTAFREHASGGRQPDTEGYTVRSGCEPGAEWRPLERWVVCIMAVINSGA